MTVRDINGDEIIDLKDIIGHGGLAQDSQMEPFQALIKLQFNSCEVLIWSCLKNAPKKEHHSTFLKVKIIFRNPAVNVALRIVDNFRLCLFFTSREVLGVAIGITTAILQTSWTSVSHVRIKMLPVSSQ